MARVPFRELFIPSTFSVLHHRSFRLLWIGTLISHSGDWMDELALNWLILELTGSPLYLGLANLCRAVPLLLFTLIGGVAADRFERRRLMLATQSVAMLLALLLAVSISLGWLSIWLVLVIATLRGVMMAFNLPARQSLISDLVPPQDLADALALNSATVNLTKIIGPSLAGLAISVLGIAACFYINALSFFAVLWTLWAMRLPTVHRELADKNVGKSLLDAFRYVRVNPAILMLVLIAVVPTIFGQPYQTMLTVFAYDVLNIGPTGLGLLTSCAALGGVLGALLVSLLRGRATNGKAMLLFMIAFGATLAAFAYSSWTILSAVLVFGAGTMNMAYNVSNNTILQLSVPDSYRGRVMSVLFLKKGLMSVGTALAGALAAAIGVRAATASMASIIILFGGALWVAVPAFRRVRA